MYYFVKLEKMYTYYVGLSEKLVMTSMKPGNLFLLMLELRQILSRLSMNELFSLKRAVMDFLPLFCDSHERNCIVAAEV